MFSTPLSIKLSIFLCLVFQVVFGQLYEVRRYADNNGLPSRIIHAVDQDNDGYLWVAGNNGLYKFDGKEFLPYYAKLSDTTGLRSNKINTVLSASDNRLWIGTPDGLHTMKNNKIQYVDLPNRPNDGQKHIISLFEDSFHNIWVGTYEGFFRIDSKSGVINNFNEVQKLKSNTSPIRGITEDMKGRVWISRSKKQPLLYIPDESKFLEVGITYKTKQIPSDVSFFKFTEFESNLFIIQSTDGLLKGVFNGVDELNIDYFYTPNNEIASRDFIYDAHIDSNNAIWIATWRNYFKKYQFVNGLLKPIEVFSSDGFQEMSGFARGVFEDRQKNIWMPNSNGLFKLSKKESPVSMFPPVHIKDCLENISVYGLVEDNYNRVWVNTPTHLYRINKEDILEGRCPNDYLMYEDNHFQLARDLFIDSKNRLWISGQGGISISQLDKYDNPGTFVHYTNNNGLPHLWSYEIIEVNENTFWATNYQSLVKIEFKNGDVSKPIFTSYNSSSERDSSLINSYTQQIGKDKHGVLWVGTFSGLSRMISEENGGIFKNYTSSFGDPKRLTNNSIKNIFNDREGRLWIGTQTGLNLYNEEEDNFMQFGRTHGLQSEYILGIDEDSKGYLWITTTNGVFKGIYNASMQSFVDITYFNFKDGLADNISNRNAIYIDSDDKVFIGSSKGISIVNGTEEVFRQRNYNLSITKLESIQQKEIGFVSILDKLNNNELDLSFKENSIQLKYAVLDFTQPEFNQYRHKFLPVNEDWIETGNNATLTYYNLPPGDYKLILDGNNNQGVWSSNPIELNITITPPFWKTNWAIFLYTLFGLGLISFFYFLRVRKRIRELEQETKLEKALIKEREHLRNENAADFHDELGSKVTKVSMFLTLVERSLKDKNDPTPWLNKIRDNVTDISGSFRDLLWVIDPQKDSLYDTFLRLKNFGEDIFENTEINFSTSGLSDIPEDVLLNAQTKKQVVLIFKEAMHNCAKYSECSVAQLNIELINGFSSITFTDNGKGFVIDKQTNGRGINNMKNRAEKIDGKLVITSSDKGTIVSLDRIPHLGEESSNK